MKYLGAVIVVAREFVRSPLMVGPYALKQRYKADPIIGCGYTRTEQIRVEIDGKNRLT